ncbi:hypothetical protein V1514DRAFT_328906, partial [Lipomyces japonicus]|uniref:uncharacterized protein n=1 Tax=Lipomyces japonicus TaxID=56871 RepID=UPI0034CD3529
MPELSASDLFQKDLSLRSPFPRLPAHNDTLNSRSSGKDVMGMGPPTFTVPSSAVRPGITGANITRLVAPSARRPGDNDAAVGLQKLFLQSPIPRIVKGSSTIAPASPRTTSSTKRFSKSPGFSHNATTSNYENSSRNANAFPSFPSQPTPRIAQQGTPKALLKESSIPTSIPIPELAEARPSGLLMSHFDATPNFPGSSSSKESTRSPVETIGTPLSTLDHISPPRSSSTRIVKKRQPSVITPVATVRKRTRRSTASPMPTHAKKANLVQANNHAGVTKPVALKTAETPLPRARPARKFREVEKIQKSFFNGEIWTPPKNSRRQSNPPKQWWIL